MLQHHYCGKITACHSYGLLGTFFSAINTTDFLLFEALSGVPYGVFSQANDANRLLGPWIDPDQGMDHALDTLGIEYELVTRAVDADASEALEHLRQWLTQGLVLLGPLNMNALPYLYYAHLFRNCDHYLIALKGDKNRFLVRDSEGYDMAWINEHDLTKAWRGDNIPEGRGGFIMRRLTDTQCPLQIENHMVLNGLIYAAKLLQASSSSERGGSQAYAFIASEEASILVWPAACRSLSYLLPTRMQRNLTACILLERVGLAAPYLANEIDRAKAITLRQTFLLAQCLSHLRGKTQHGLQPLNEVAELEDQLTIGYRQMEEMVCDAALII